MAITPEQAFYSDFNRNVTALNTARKLLTKQFNDSLKRNDKVALQVLTHIYALLYFSWTEAMLVKLVHTPFGFTTDEKSTILDNKDVLQKWKTAIRIAFDRFTIRRYEIPKRLKRLNGYIQSYLQDQARVRNKIAHGQWEYPLQRNNIIFDQEAKIFIDCLDFLQIDLWFDVFTQFSEIAGGIIDSREKNGFIAHFDHYIQKVQNIDQLREKRKNYSLAAKRKVMLEKDARKPKLCPICPY